MADETFIVKQQLEADTSKFIGPMEKAKVQTEKTDKSLNVFRRSVKRGKEDIQKFGKSVKTEMNEKLKKTLTPFNLTTIAITGLTTATILSLKEFAKYETALTKINSIARISRDELTGLGNDLFDVAIKTGTDYAEVMEGSYQALSSGIESSNLPEFMERMGKLAVVGYTDIATATDTTTTVMNAYGMSIDKVNDVSDTLLNIQNQGKVTVGELGKSLSGIIPIASQMGVEFDILGASIATMTANGVPASEVTTQMKAFIGELANETTNASKFFKELTGVGFKEYIASGKDLADVSEVMSKGTQAFGTSLFGVFGSQEAVSFAMSNSGINALKYKENLSVLNKEMGIVDKEHEKAMTTIEKRWQELVTKSKQGMVSIGDGVKVFAVSTVDIVKALWDPFGLSKEANKFIEEARKNIEEAEPVKTPPLDTEETKKSVEETVDFLKMTKEAQEQFAQNLGVSVDYLLGVYKKMEDARNKSGGKSSEKDTRVDDFERETIDPMENKFYEDLIQKEIDFQNKLDEISKNGLLNKIKRDELEKEHNKSTELSILQHNADILEKQQKFYEDEMGDYKTAYDKRIQLEKTYAQIQQQIQEDSNDKNKSLSEEAYDVWLKVKDQLEAGRIADLKDLANYTKEVIAQRLRERGGDAMVIGISELGLGLADAASLKFAQAGAHFYASAQNLAIASAFGVAASNIAPGNSQNQSGSSELGGDYLTDSQTDNNLVEREDKKDTLIIQGLPDDFFDMITGGVDRNMRDKYDQYLIEV